MTNTTNLKKVLCSAAAVSAACFFISTAQASESGGHENHQMKKSAEIHLSPDLKEILNQEMNGIENGVMKIIPAIAAGDWETIAKIAQQIKASFILKQKLTPEQLKELHNSLPPEFVEMDMRFHSNAEKLAGAAHQRDGELVTFYFSKLHGQCMTCHAKYAPERFPGLNKQKPAEKEHH